MSTEFPQSPSRLLQMSQAAYFRQEKVALDSQKANLMSLSFNAPAMEVFERRPEVSSIDIVAGTLPN